MKSYSSMGHTLLEFLQEMKSQDWDITAERRYGSHVCVCCGGCYVFMDGTVLRTYLKLFPSVLKPMTMTIGRTVILRFDGCNLNSAVRPKNHSMASGAGCQQC